MGLRDTANEDENPDLPMPSLGRPERTFRSSAGQHESLRSIAERKAKAPLLRNDMPDHVAVPVTNGSQRGRLSRTLVNFWLDTLLAAVFVTLLVTAVIVQFVFPPGVAARGWTLWGMTYGRWCSLQFGLIAALGLGVLVHVMLHWTWVCSVLTKRVLHREEIPDDGLRTIYGVGLLICLLLSGAVAIGIAQWMMVPPE